MNLDYLRTFIEVVKTGNFSEVAKKLNISQPAVSFQIQKLEADLGIRLMDRNQKKVILTDAGKKVLLFAENVESQTKKLLESIDNLRETVSGDLVVTASTVPGEFILPKILSSFKEKYPAIGIKVGISDSINVITDVKSGKYEVGFCGFRPEDNELEYFKMGSDEIVLIVPAGHPLSYKKKVFLGEIAGESLIFREESSGTRLSLENMLTKSGFDINRIKPKLILGTSQAVISSVEVGIGIAFVSSLAIKKSIDLGLVKVIPAEGLKLERSFFCVYRKEMVVSRLVTEFISFVKLLTN
ncbi:MAG: selenium metabolism-associated LysR family transcriptional regulator [Chloroflexi bacterium]|nr:selenium metabolism-associated LysR family transcriptional regulator [Chloroflexota bacterium]